MENEIEDVPNHDTTASENDQLESLESISDASPAELPLESETQLPSSQSKSQQVTTVNDVLTEVRPSFNLINKLNNGSPNAFEGEADQCEQEPPAIAELEPPFKKNRRVQVPSSDITRGISSIEPSPKKPLKKKLHDPTPQKIGILVGIPCRRRPSKGLSPEDAQLDIIKHFALVFLFSRLKNPSKWDVKTFEEIKALGDNISSALVMSKFSVPYEEKIYHLLLTGTIAKGRIRSTNAPPPNFKNALIEHISGYSGLVLKCETHYLITWRTAEGYYLYDPCIRDTSQLAFFNSLKMMMQFILEVKQLNDRSKFYMSKISIASVEEDNVVTLKRRSRTASRFLILSENKALLMGDKYLKDPSFRLESLRISLNAIDCSRKLETRSWDATVLNGLFGGKMTDKVINKLGIFFNEEDGSEHCFLLEQSRLIRMDVAFGSTQREEFEQLINRLLAIRIAVVLKIEEACVAIWSSENIIYWFCPLRYDELELDPLELEDKACFLYAFDSLPCLSSVLFSYLTESRLLPRHSIRVLAVDSEPFGPSPRVPLVDSSDSLNRSELEIHIADGIRKRILISDEDFPVLTLSEAKLCRIMLRDIVQEAERKCD
ncbi:uncharacterized protein LOC129718638 isoform X2 [Wyeomyia smithii]|uniref:uncharacterized protein LOC129718638 isoform X2 n=1 Tax=Wyeomyia smithii TaxID=174621 RepID=UPI002467B33D|nr:uncharacterized protein LOC129718638 isoform X2 [Wyeomyia smithii]